MAELKVDMKAPEFSLPAGDDSIVSLKDFRGKKVVLYFYPKDNTPGCTKEACSFEEHAGRIRKLGAVTIGVSPDSGASHRSFSTKFGLSFPLVSDVDKTLCKQYGVWQEKKFMGRTYMGVVRSTFIIDGKGRIAKVFRNVKVDGHTEEVLEALSSVGKENPD